MNFYSPALLFSPLFTGVRGIGILRTSPFGDSPKFAVAKRRWHYAPQKKVLAQRASAIPARRLPMRIITGLLIVAVAMLVAVGGLVLVQRLFSTERRKQHNDVAGFIYAVLGVAYAVLLGLMLIAVWEQWNAAEALTTDEANELAGIFWWAHALPQPEGRHIQELVRSYTEVVVEEEWPLMAQGRSSPKAWATLDELRGAILGLNPPKGGEIAGRWAGSAPYHVGSANPGRSDHGRLHLPLRLGGHLGAPADGSGIGDDHLHESIHRCCPRLPLQWRYTYPSGRL